MTLQSLSTIRNGIIRNPVSGIRYGMLRYPLSGIRNSKGGQVLVEFALSAMGVVVMAFMCARIVVWMNQTMVDRNNDYQDSRTRAGQSILARTGAPGKTGDSHLERFGYFSYDEKVTFPSDEVGKMVYLLDHSHDGEQPANAPNGLPVQIPGDTARLKPCNAWPPLVDEHGTVLASELEDLNAKR